MAESPMTTVPRSEPGSQAPPPPVSIDKVVGRVSEVSTLPQVALRVMEVVNDPNTGASELRMVVESDPALSTRVLRCVNSAAHGLRTKVTCLQRAISYLGFKQIRNLAITASVSQVFKVEDQCGPYRRSGLWRHMVSVGVAARFIATRIKMAGFEEVFLAGLLHDLGIILEDQYCNPVFRHAMHSLKPDQPLVETEQRIIGFDHTCLGNRIAETWKFPKEVRDVMRYHHMPDKYRGEHTQSLACVELANLLCTVKGVPSVGLNLIQPTLWSMNTLGLSKEQVKVLFADLDHELKQNESLFRV